MDDALLVSRAKAGDLDAFGQLYDQYFNRIYDFNWRIIRNSDEAADVTQDVFMKAMQNLPGLEKVSSFKSWLFTIAHNSAVTRAERSARTVPLPQPVHEEAFGTFDVPDASRLNDPDLAAGDAELASLVWEAAEALNPRDYALLDLHVRQGLDSAEIASVMGVSKGNAYTMVSRMKTAAGDVIGSYVVARRGSQDCDALREVLSAFSFPPYTELVRKAVDEHIKACDLCGKARKRFTTPLEIFGGFALVPAPLALKGDVWGDVSAGWHVTGPGAVSGVAQPALTGSLPRSPYAIAGGGGIGGGAFMPGTSESGWDRSRIMWFIGGVAGLLIFAFAGGALISGAFGGGDDDGGATVATVSPTRTATPAVTRTPGVAIETPSPDLTPPTEPPADTVTPTAAPATPSPSNTAVSVTPTAAGTLTTTPTGAAGSPTPTATPAAIGTPTPTTAPCSFCPTATPTP